MRMRALASATVALSALVVASPGSLPARATPSLCVAVSVPGSDPARGVSLVPEGSPRLGWQRGRLVVGPGLCLGASGDELHGGAAQLRACDPYDAGQDWHWKRKWLQADDGEALFVLRHPSTALVLERGDPGDAGAALALRPFVDNNDKQQFLAGRCSAGWPAEAGLAMLR